MQNFAFAIELRDSKDEWPESCWNAKRHIDSVQNIFGGCVKIIINHMIIIGRLAQLVRAWC